MLPTVVVATPPPAPLPLIPTPAKLGLNVAATFAVGVEVAAAAADVEAKASPSDCVDVAPIRQTVSQPARGHQVRVLSNSISIRQKIIKYLYNDLICFCFLCLGL